MASESSIPVTVCICYSTTTDAGINFACITGTQIDAIGYAIPIRIYIRDSAPTDASIGLVDV
jgi:hypothetical protein